MSERDNETHLSEHGKDRQTAWIAAIHSGSGALTCVASLSVFVNIVPLAVSLAWLAVFATAFVFTQPRRSVGAGFAGLAKIALYGLFVAAFALVVGEAGARFIFTKPMSTGYVFEPHPECYFMLKPGSRAVRRIRVSEDEVRIVEQKISSQGLRDRVFGPKRPGETRIFMLGDSYTQGFTVPVEQTISRFLEDEIRLNEPDSDVTCINGGIEAANPIQAYYMLKERGLPLEPDMVVLQLYMGNDVHGCVEMEDAFLNSYNVMWNKWLRLTRNRGRFAVEAEVHLERHSVLYREILGVTARETWVVNAWNLVRGAPRVNLTPLPPSLRREPDLEVNLETWYPELAEGAEMLREWVLRIARLCEENGIDFYVYNIPAIRVMDDAWWDGQHHKEAWSVWYDRHKPQRFVEETFEDAGIPAMSMYSALDAAGPFDAVYFAHDGHLNDAGNKIVAQTLYSFIFPGGNP